MTAPADADSANARYLIQGGFIEREAAGIYNFLPLGYLVLRKIEQIIREEMNAVGGQEIHMPVIHPRENWIKTGRDELMDAILYRTKGHAGSEFVLGPSHEEIVTPLVKKFIQSYKDLPLAVYQIQTKFRNEPRAKSGILRGREFGMKDMYSFHATEEDLDEFYKKAIEAYLKIYRRLGLQAYVIEASGGTFTDKYSHEFSVKAIVGEDTILICEKCGFGQNEEIAKVKDRCQKCQGSLRKEKAIEAGNIFKLGTKFSKDFGLIYTDENGVSHPLTMGCYGIGVTRLMGTIVEASHDDKGIIWPESVAPFTIHLLYLGNEKEVKDACEELYKKLQAQGQEVLFDDRDESAGKKLADADLIGIPNRVLVSAKTLQKKSAEWKKRNEKESHLTPL